MDLGTLQWSRLGCWIMDKESEFIRIRRSQIRQHSRTYCTLTILDTQSWQTFLNCCSFVLSLTGQQCLWEVNTKFFAPVQFSEHVWVNVFHGGNVPGQKCMHTEGDKFNIDTTNVVLLITQKKKTTVKCLVHPILQWILLAQADK